MKEFLRLMGEVCPNKKLSAVSYERSVLPSWLATIPNLIPKTHYLISNKQLSAVSNQLSEKDLLIRVVGKLMPKTHHLIPILFLVFVSCGAALAQEPVGHTAPAAKAETDKNANKHEYVTEENAIKRAIGVDKDADIINFPLVKYNPDYSGIKGLKIGDRIPDELWDMPLWVINHPEDKDTIRLREYKDEKLLVLDFWARFCSPCIKSMDTWDGFVDKTNGQVKLIGVQLDYDYRALRTSKKQGWKSPSVIGNEAYLINRYFFDRNVISRMAWIKDGKLLAVTSVRGYDFDTVQKVLNNEPVTLPIDSNWTYFNTNSLNQ